ncbi:DsbA family protein [Sinimarinibacterium thermocellulolyticum]|uniref:DsbA family protein n=1 Tax=Sinimarinibacterium thermocellulolyticum TaxID=3170016 RepID=A0ABV2A7E1_9GAMM
MHTHQAPRWLPQSGLPPSFASRIAERIARSRDPIARLHAGRALELYYEVGDPHSQLAAALARRMRARLGTRLDIRVVPAPDAQTYPEAAKQRDFAARDAARLAPCHDLPAPVAVPPAQHAAMQALLAQTRDADEFLAVERECLAALAEGRSLTAPGDAGQTTAVLAANAQRRRKLGHYLPGMWQYRGEWFWAIDRLDFLHARLTADGVLSGDAPLSVRDSRRLVADGRDPTAPLEFWFSFRSPYSYLAAVQLLRQRERGRHPHLTLRPVLPMVMRGLPVPAIKRLYIVRDVQRCADAQGIAFGKIHDPVGDGVLRVLSVFPYDADTDTQLRFAAIAMQSIWAEGLDLRRDANLASVFARCGLDWTHAQAALARGIDTTHAQAHRDALFDAGLWGVPSFRQGRFTTWGQDRIWMLDTPEAAHAA